MADLIIPVASLIESGSGSEMVDIQFSALDLQFMNRSFWQDGLLDNISDNGKVTPLTGLQVSVAAVAALIDGTVCKRPEATTLTVAQGGAQKRYDLVIIKRNLATRSFSIELKQGVEGGTKPTLAYTVGGLCEFELATIEVSAGALTISSGDITNTTVIIDPRPNLDERFADLDMSNTDYKEVLDGLSEGSLFGARVDKTSNYSAQQAPTDGIVEGYITGGNYAIIEVYVDNNANPSTLILKVDSADENALGMPFSFTVAKNEYWKIVFIAGGAMGKCWFRPLKTF